MLELTLGRYDEALSRLGAIAVGPLHQSQPVIAPLSITDFAEAAARAGRPEEARPMIEPYEAYVARTQTPFAVATLHRVRGLLGDGEEGEEELRAAIAQFEAADLAPFALARTRLFLGERLRRDRRRKDARDHLRLAAEAFGRMGMRPWEERALAELRATGETLRRHDAGGLDELTPQELQIARLVASGARNREIGTQLFLSPRTIDYHLRKVFAKLGISSRGELARLPLDPATDAERVPVGA